MSELIHESARVLEVSENFAWVVPDQHNGCARCAARAGCGAQLFAGVLRRRRTRLRVVNTVGATVGDRVEIAVARSALLRGAFSAYMLPLLGMFVAGYCGEVLAPVDNDVRELWVLTFAIGGFGAGLWLVSRQLRGTGFVSHLQPIVVKTLHRPSTESIKSFYSGENR